MPTLPLIIAHLVPTLDYGPFREKVPYWSEIVPFHKKKCVLY